MTSLCGVLNYTCNQVFSVSLQSSSYLFHYEKPYIRQEYSLGLYSSLAYILSRYTMNVFIFTLCSLVYALLIQFGVGLALSLSHFCIFSLLIVLLSIASSTFGLFFSYFFESIETAKISIMFTNLVLIYPAGFFVN